MSEHQKQTEFMMRCLLYEDTVKSRQLAESIARVQKDERRVKRAVRLMTVLVVLAIVGLCYSAVFLAYYPHTMLGFTTHFVTQVFCVLGLVSTICLLVFACLGLVYRKDFNHRLEECRQLVTKLMKSRLGQPVVIASQDNRAGDKHGGAVPIIPEVNSSSGQTELTARS